MPRREQLSLAELRRRIDAAASARARNRIARALAGDPRRGARQLAEQLLERESRRKRERKRIAKLLARRKRLQRSGFRFVAGVDEVGVGPLAGPLVAAAVILPDAIDLDAFDGLDDSKRLNAATRERLADQIRGCAVAISIGTVPVATVDRLNVYHAAREAMRRAVVGLRVAPDHVLVDARTIPGIGTPQTPLVHGDAVDATIAAAAIVAKVHRDELMRRLDERHPGYGFGRHMGYGTEQHLAALARLGPSPEHRRSFAPVGKLSAASE